MKNNMLDAFLKRCRADQAKLMEELRSYPPTGVMRLWTGRSPEAARDITEERVSAIKREHARIEATVEFVTAVGKVL
jgi:hypothetical protein